MKTFEEAIKIARLSANKPASGKYRKFLPLITEAQWAAYKPAWREKIFIGLVTFFGKHA